jgi:hypothetical protein
MAIVLHIVQGILALMAIGLLLGFTGSKRVGLLLAAIVYGGGAYASYAMNAWWPLLVAFVGAWGLRFLGFDPDPN